MARWPTKGQTNLGRCCGCLARCPFPALFSNTEVATDNHHSKPQQYISADGGAKDGNMDGPTLITQPPGYPEERPETDDMDGMLEHLASELEGKQLLEKPRVSKKVTLLQQYIRQRWRTKENTYVMCSASSSCCLGTYVYNNREPARRAESLGGCIPKLQSKLAKALATKLHRIQNPSISLARQQH